MATKQGVVAEHKLDPEEMAKLEDPERAGRMPPEDVVELLDPHPGVRCLDLGCGTGYLARPLASHLAPGGVVGVDESSAMLRELGRRAEEAGVWVARVQADAVSLPFPDGAFGRVLSLNLHHELDARAAALEEAARVLEDGGRVLVVDWAPEDGGGGPPEEHRVEAGEVQVELEGLGFVDIEAHDGFAYHWAVTAERAD